MTLTAQSIPWTGTRAVLLVHGVGNARVGDYADLVQQVERVLGDEARRTVVYMFYYDQVNDWFVAKQQANLLFASFAQALRSLLAALRLGASDPAALGNAIADLVGDVLWPVLLADARNAVRATLLDQLFQIVADARQANVPPRDMELSIIAHSMGCFHVYEALQSIAAEKAIALGPAAGLQYANVIYMASPVQLIRSVIERISIAVPQRESIRSLSQALALPEQRSLAGSTTKLARRTVAITGNLDPVGGHFFRERPDWGFMNLPGQETRIDEQHLAQVNGSDEFALTEVLHTALRERSAPTITPNNPHSWSEYVRRHESDLRDWLVPA
jgi:hypothetical protein